MVRCKGLVEATRVLVVDVMAKVVEVEAEAETETETETEGDASAMETDGGSTWEEVGEGGKWEMEVAKVYEMTIVQLGLLLGDGQEFGVATSG